MRDINMSCGCMNNKKLNLEDMKNMSVDDIVRLYRDGYRLEGMSGDSPYTTNSNMLSGDPPVQSVNQLQKQLIGLSAKAENQLSSADNLQLITVENNDIYSMSPEVMIIYSEGYEQVGLKMTVDILVRNPEPNPLIVQFKFYSTDATPIYLGAHVACIQPYSIPQNANGCTKVRVVDLPFKDPYVVKVHRCISSPNCAVPSCAAFQAVPDNICLAEVKTYGGIVPPLTSFPPAGAVKCGGGTLNMAVDCISCTPSWACEQPLNGYEYDSCTQQRRLNTACTPLIPTSKISVTTDTVSPFDKGRIVRLYGTLESGSIIISGADVVLTIDVGGAEVVRQHLTTGSSRPNWTYDWTVPSTIAGVDTTGMSVVVVAYFAQTAQYQSSTVTANYAIAGVTCTDMAVTASKTTAKVGDKITITALTKPLGTSFPVIINLDGRRLGTCDTLAALGSVSSIQNSKMLSQQSVPGRIQTLQNTISILNPPTSVIAGQTINFQISYNLSLDWFGEWVRFRICSGSVEIGNTIQLLFGNASGTASFDATIPSMATGTVPIYAQVTIDEFSSTCADPAVIATTLPINIPVSSYLNVLSIIDPPDSIMTGRVDIKLGYTLTVDILGEWVRFRVCDSTGRELGFNIALLSGTSSGTVTIGASIPSDVTGSITIKGEVTIDELNGTCGDPDVITVTTSRTIPITIQASGTISLIQLPAAVRAGQAADFKINYNLNVGWFEWVRFRICSGSTEIGNYKRYFIVGGDNTGVVTVNSMIPSSAVGNVPIKAEVTLEQDDATCGSAVLASSSIANIPVTTAKQGECQIVWDTTGSTGGVHYITAEVLGHCATVAPFLITLTAPPDPCTSISLGISKSNPVVGDVVDLVAHVQPPTSSLNVTFKAGNTAIGSTCISSGGACTTKWNTAGLTPGVYKLIATVEGQCSSLPLDVTISSTAAVCTSITTPTATPSTANIGAVVTLRATAQPTTSIFTVSFKDQNNNVLGTANTSSGIATLQWNTTEKSAGIYNIMANVGTQCSSPTSVAVTLNAPIIVCTSITTPTAIPSTVTIGDVVTLSATAQPTTSTFAVDFKDQNNNLIGSANTESGVATVQWSTTGNTAGTYNIKAYTGTCVSPTAISINLNAAVACTSITVPTTTLTTVTIGGTVTLTATAQPSTSIFGVAFKDQNNNVLGTADTVGGVATIQWNTTGKTAGTYNIKAYTGTCSSPTAITITLNTPTTTCTSITVPIATPTTVTIGQVVTLSATAQPTTATFTVDFKDQNNNVIGSANTSSGVASYVWNTGGISAGTYNIKAYVGTCISPGPVAVTVSPTTTVCTSITIPLAMPTVVTVGQSLALRATIQPTTSIFTVDFKGQDNNIVCSANTVGGVATCNWNTTGKTAGTYNVKAYTGTCVSPTAIAITLNPSEIACTSVTTPTTSLATVIIGGTVTLTATVQPSTTVFNVSFKDQNNNVLGTANTVNGVATLQWSTAGKTAGAYQIKAMTNSTLLSTDSCISPAAITVTLNTPTTACTSITVPTATPTTVTIGQVVTLSATAQPTTATFTVDFKDQNNNVIGSANTSSGVASCVWNTGGVSAGTYNIKAYVGTCVSLNPVIVTVNQTTTVCTSVTTPLAMPSSVMVGELIALRATVQPTTSIFTVDFKDQNNNVIGSANTSAGVAAYNWNTTGKSAGTYQIKAYAGTCVSPTAVVITLSAAPGVPGVGGGIVMMAGLVGVAALGMMMMKPKPK